MNDEEEDGPKIPDNLFDLIVLLCAYEATYGTPSEYFYLAYLDSKESEREEMMKMTFGKDLYKWVKIYEGFVTKRDELLISTLHLD